MQDHPRSEGRGGVLPVAFLRTVFPRADKHVRNVLRVGNIAVGGQPNLRQRIKPGRVFGLYGGELEADLTSLAAETRGLAPILPFNVVDHWSFLPHHDPTIDYPHSFAPPLSRKLNPP